MAEKQYTPSMVTPSGERRYYRDEEAVHDVDSALDSSSTNPVENRAIAMELAKKADLKKAADVAGMGNDDTHAYSGEAVSMAISSAVSGNVGGFLGDMTVAQLNAYTAPKMGDNAIVTDTGTITVGSEQCVISAAPAEVRWTTSGSWKVSSAGYVRDTQYATANAPGVVKTSSADGGVSLDANNRMIVNGLGSAAFKDVPSSGNASSSQVVLGDDSRLSDSRTPTSHSHTTSDITGLPTELPVKIEEIGSSAIDLDSLTASDMKVHYYTWSNGNRGNVSHKPTDAVYTVKVFPCGTGSAGTYVMQEAYKRGTTERYVRRRSDGGTTWSDWQLCTYSNGSYPDMGVGAANEIIPSEFVATSSGTWVEVGTYKASSAGKMYSGITFAVKLRGSDTKTQSGFLWISVGENKSPATYSNDDIVCEYYTLGRRTKEVPASVKFYVNILGTSVTDGVKIYAHVDSWSLFSVTAINVSKGDYTPSMASVSEPATKKEVTYSNLLRSTYGTAIGDATSPVYVDQYGIVRVCDPMAKKASSGNGNLAVIDSNGNYASSGISAYSQSQLNAAIANNVFPWMLDNSYVMTRSFWLTITSAVTGKVMDFRNAYTGENLLRIGFYYDNEGDLQIYIPWNNAQWNQWIIATEGTADVGYAFITANGTKHSSSAGADTVTPYFAQNESTLHLSGQSESIIGRYSIGTSTLYDTSAYYNFCIMLGNAESGKLVRLNLSVATKRYASGTKKAEITVFATLDASGLNE